MVVVNARFLTQQLTGVQRFAIEISKILCKLSNDIVFVTPGNIVHPELANELGAIVTGKNTGSVWEQTDLRRYLISKNRPLLVNFCNTGVAFYSRQIVTIHDMSYKVNPKWFSRAFYLWYNFLIPHLAKNSLRVFTVSNSAKTDIIQYLKIEPDKISVIYNSSYLNTNDNFEPFSREKYILTVSSLDPRKNLRNLVTAFKQTHENLKLVLVGLKNHNFAIDNELLDERIIIKGHVPDPELSSLIKNAEVFVYLSFYEGFGLPPLEAMGIGCPVVVSDIPAHREVCADAALYAKPHDIEDIKNKIASVLGNDKLRQKLIEAGKQNVKRFDWDGSAKKVLTNIHEIVEKYN